MKRAHLGTAIGATAASVALGMTLAGPAGAVSPDPPAPFCAAEGFSQPSPGSSEALPDANATGISKTISVTGRTGVVRDVDVVTNVRNAVNGDIEIELRHTPPGGTVKIIRFVTQKLAGRGGTNGFNGTRWDDSALKVVSEEDFGASGPKLNLVPEGAMASLIGRNPNGTWTVVVKDLDPLGTQGFFDGWTLDVKTSPALPATTPQPSPPGPGGAIPDAGAGALTRTVQISGQKGYLTDLDLVTAIEHLSTPSDLQVKLTSPAGTTVFISNRRGDGSEMSLTTRWDDSALETLIGVEDAWGGINPLTRESLVPEGALGAFIGENPNGTWTITIADVDPLQTGTLHSWSLAVSSTDPCAPPPPPPPPPPPGLPGGPACTKVNLATTILGAKRSERGDVANVKVKVANKTRTAGARGAKAVFKLPAGFTLAGKQKGIALKKGKITATFGAIAGGKAKTKTIKLKAKAGAAFGLKTSSVAVTALCGSKAKAAKIKLTLVRG